MQSQLLRSFTRVARTWKTSCRVAERSQLNNCQSLFLKNSCFFSDSNEDLKNKNNKNANNPKEEKSIDEILKEAETIDFTSDENSFVFETPLQNLSISLMKVTNASQALDLYEQEIERNPDMSGEELALILYYACFFRGDLIHDTRVKPLLNLIMERLDGITSIYLFSLAYCLGILSSDYEIELSAENQKKIADKLIENMSDYPAEQLSSLCFSATQFLTKQNDDLVRLISSLTDKAIDHADILKGVDFANFFATFAGCRYNDIEKINKLYRKMYDRMDKLETEDPAIIVKLIMCLAELNVEATSFYTDLFINTMKPSIESYPANDLCLILLIFSEKMSQAPYVFKDLLKETYKKKEELSIESYVNIWLALAKFRADPNEYDKQLGVITKIPFESQQWSRKDFEDFDIVNLIVAMATIKYNNKDFLKSWVDILQERLVEIDKDELINLARAFVIYIKQFENFYQAVHDECSKRITSLDEEDRLLLSSTFTKARDYLPRQSPFIDPTLY